jgi:hypothetical protein
MQQDARSVVEPWSMAKFPSRGQLQRFVSEVRIWNRVEGLPPIVFELLPDGTRLRFRSQGEHCASVFRYIDSFGASIKAPR